MKTSFQLLINVLIIIVLNTVLVFSQLDIIDTTITLDLLKSPQNPAFNMLGISPENISRPSDLSQFKFSLQQTGRTISTIPNSYGIEIAPFLMGHTNHTLERFNSKNPKDVIRQSFSISMGYSNLGPLGKETVDSLTIPQLGLGIKFSLIRPSWDNSTQFKYKKMNTALRRYHSKFIDYFSDFHSSREELETIQASILNNTSLDQNTKDRLLDSINEEIRLNEDQIKSDFNLRSKDSSYFLNLIQEASAFNIVRKGAFLDFNSGFVLEFPTSRFDYSKVGKAGMWLTGGYDNGDKGISSLFILRYLYQPEAIFANDSAKLSTEKVSTLDFGGRLLLSSLGDKLNISTEALYRSILNLTYLKPSWRLVFNAEYDLGDNKRITFAFGRNFDGGISKGGNLISSLNFITGLGNKKKV